MSVKAKVKAIVRKNPKPLGREAPLKELIAGKTIMRYGEHQSLRMDKSSMGECTVCCEDKLLFHMGLCMHSACVNCINYHFESCQRQSKALTCIECNLTINTKQLKMLHTAGVHLEYYNYQKRTINGLIKYAYGKTPCPKVGASDRCPGYGRPTAWLGVLICDTCNENFCKFCKGNHKGGCMQIDVDEHAMQRWLHSMNMVQCPKCEQGIQRSAGCKWVTCTCGMNVCTACGQSGTTTHFHHNCSA